MQYLFISTLIFMNCLQLFAQGKTKDFTAKEQEIVTVIQKMFDGMRKSDSSMVKSVLHPSIRMQTSFVRAEKPIFMTEPNANNFLNAVASPKKEIFDERIESYEIRIDDNLATVWTPYKFYLGDKFIHCGVNTFVLCKTENGWQISHIADTRRKENCNAK